MAIIDLIKAETPVPEKQPYITVTRGGRGWFALVNMLILKGKYGPNTSAPSTPIAALREKAKMHAAKGDKVVMRGNMLYVNNELVQ